MKNSDNLHKLSNYFEGKLVSLAAKERTNKKKINKEWEKSKAEYAKIKAIVDDLQGKKQDAEQKLESASNQCSAARKKMMGLMKTIQHMDISNASDAVFYNDDYGDVGYVIGNKEYHLSLNDDGEMSIVPMLTHRRNRKQQNQPSALNEQVVGEEDKIAEDLDAEKDEDPKEHKEGDDADDCEDVGFIHDLSLLYADLVE